MAIITFAEKHINLLSDAASNGQVHIPLFDVSSQRDQGFSFGLLGLQMSGGIAVDVSAALEAVLTVPSLGASARYDVEVDESVSDVLNSSAVVDTSKWSVVDAILWSKYLDLSKVGVDLQLSYAAQLTGHAEGSIGIDIAGHSYGAQLGPVSATLLDVGQTDVTILDISADEWSPVTYKQSFGEAFLDIPRYLAPESSDITYLSPSSLPVLTLEGLVKSDIRS